MSVISPLTPPVWPCEDREKAVSAAGRGSSYQNPGMGTLGSLVQPPECEAPVSVYKPPRLRQFVTAAWFDQDG